VSAVTRPYLHKAHEIGSCELARTYPLSPSELASRIVLRRAAGYSVQQIATMLSIPQPVVAEVIAAHRRRELRNRNHPISTRRSTRDYHR
jgi:DNA-binding MarR family transcriptional regulator